MYECPEHSVTIDKYRQISVICFNLLCSVFSFWLVSATRQPFVSPRTFTKVTI